MPKLKLYTFEDSEFNYIAIYIARNKKQAKDFFKEKCGWKNQDIKEIKIEERVFLEGGGNG